MFMAKGIHRIIRLGIFVLFLMLLAGIPSKAEAYCLKDTELGDDLKPCFLPHGNYYGPQSQGFCFAGDKIIYTRYTADYATTTYVILDAKTMKEINCQSFNTLHSNSLTYNPTTKEVVCVSKNHAYVFSFDGESLELTADHYMNHNCPKIAYVSSEDVYYLGTSTVIYKTKDFQRLTPVFRVPQIAVNQGMASDGINLYIVWYSVGNCSIYEYTTLGQLVEIFTLKSDRYREIEELDFYGPHIYLSIENSGDLGGIYRVKNTHNYDKWDVLQKPTCTSPGRKRHICKRCGKIEEKDMKPTGHIFGEWETVHMPDVLHYGIMQRSCFQCGQEEDVMIDPIAPEISMDDSELVLGRNDTAEAREVKLGKGDYIEKWTSSDPSVVFVDKDGSISAEGFGKAVVRCYSAGGATASYPVKVSILESIF